MVLKIDREKVAQAHKEIFAGELLLFNTRLEALIETGDAKAVDDLLSQGVTMRANNCGCNNGCDAAALETIPR